MKFLCSARRNNEGVDSKVKDACPYPQTVEQIRKEEYPLLEKTSYLDHAGTTPYPKSLIRGFDLEMTSHLFGNPHSHSPSSALSTDRVESTRVQALKSFQADPEYFDLVFVANATAAIKLVMDCVVEYSQTQGGFWYGYHGDSHTSLVGVREVATHGSTCFGSDEEVEHWLSGRARSRHVTLQQSSEDDNGIGLFAYPAQSNMNGRRLPLGWPGRIRSSAGARNRKTYILLDAAALVATAPLDLSDHENAPDFTALSFYKIFGFPDLGALIVRKEAGHVLGKRRYFGGGTVDMVINGQVAGTDKADWYARKTTSLHEMLEDGTPAFHSIVALKVALRVHTKLFGSMANVSSYTCRLAKTLYEQLSKLSHANGLSVCQIYKSQHSQYGDSKTQGPTIAFNVRNRHGEWIGKSDLEALAILNNIQIRTGGLCNPGGIASSLEISPTQMLENFREGLRCGNEVDEMNGKPTGVVRVSLGAMSTAKDTSRFVQFMQVFVDNTTRSMQEILASGPAEFVDKPSMQNIGRSHRLKYDVQIGEIPAGITCPVAACPRVFETREDLVNHFPLHGVRGRRRHLWSKAIPDSGGEAKFYEVGAERIRGRPNGSKRGLPCSPLRSTRP